MKKIPIVSSRGFTLVEVMVSLACMGIAFVALMGMHLVSVRTDTRNTRESEALSFATQKMEELRAEKFDDLADGVFTDDPDPKMSREWRVARAAGAAGQWRRNLTVTVTWTDRIGAAVGNQRSVDRSAELHSLVVSLK